MKRKITSLIVCTMMCAVVFLTNVPSTISAFGTTIYVDDDNTSGIEDGSILYPYNTIQEGVDAASPGDTVYVFSGIYHETINIGKPLNLQGEDRNTTIIDGVGGSGDVIHIIANWVYIHGFKITYSGSPMFNTGIELDNVQNCKIINNDISSVFFYGIYLSTTENITIKDNKIHNTAWGIYITHSYSITVQGNEIFNNWANGIDSEFSSNNNFLNNIVHDITNSAFFFSGTPYHSNNVIGNKVYNNNDGIHFEDHTGRDKIMYWNNHIINNTVYNNMGDGIFLGSEGENNHIIGNLVYENGVGSINPQGGIVISSTVNNSIMENTVNNNNYGILLVLTHSRIPPENNIVANNICDSNEYGIYFDECKKNKVFGNTIISNNRYGILLTRSTRNVIYHNRIINNTNQKSDSNPSNNHWHHPQLFEGNYWSDYTGADNGSGTGKHAIAGDGIGDTLIPHPAQYYDYYPLMEPSTPAITPSIDIDPDTLNLKSKGHWITCYIDLPGYDVNDIDIGTVILEDTILAEWGDIQNDTLMVKFDRSEVEDMLSPGTYNLKVSGELTDGTSFEGYSDEIRVIAPPYDIFSSAFKRIRKSVFRLVPIPPIFSLMSLMISSRPCSLCPSKKSLTSLGLER